MWHLKETSNADPEAANIFFGNHVWRRENRVSSSQTRVQQKPSGTSRKLALMTKKPSEGSVMTHRGVVGRLMKHNVSGPTMKHNDQTERFIWTKNK